MHFILTQTLSRKKWTSLFKFLWYYTVLLFIYTVYKYNFTSRLQAVTMHIKNQHSLTTYSSCLISIHDFFFIKKSCWIREGSEHMLAWYSVFLMVLGFWSPRACSYLLVLGVDARRVLGEHQGIQHPLNVKITAPKLQKKKVIFTSISID